MLIKLCIKRYIDKPGFITKKIKSNRLKKRYRMYLIFLLK